MNEWTLEHTGTIRAVRSKMARIKKNDTRYYTRRKWIIEEKNCVVRGVFYALKSMRIC